MSSENMLRLGIDIGSKTAKMVLLDEGDKIVFSQYSLHRSNVLQTFSELLGNTIWRFGDHEIQLCVTGSSGMRFAQDLVLPYAQEVIATRRALQAFLPEVDVAIELGGEDAKILFLRGSAEERMNGSCAGGTGGFLDLMRDMLSVRAKDFNALAAACTHIYPIASRCAVFAQADVRPLINAGARKSDIAASVMQAVVTQTVSGLACGRKIEGNVAFLGGPCEVYSELVQRFRRTLGLTHSQTFKPANAHLFVASGAALIAGDRAGRPDGALQGLQGRGPKQFDRPEQLEKEGRHAQPELQEQHLTLQSLKDQIDALPQEQEGSLGRLPALFATDEEYTAFKERHGADKVNRSRIMDYEGDVFIGVDAGSTTLKLVAINAQGELLYNAYENNQGDVVETMREALGEFYRAAPHEYDGTPLTTVRRSLVCGYGEKLLKAAFRLESGEVETVAHLRAALEFCPDASFVLDIGGQDIKCLRLKEGQIDDIMLNEACSSGCGALIQGFARSLGHTKWTFAAEALKAQSPVDLGTRCTVFMTSRVRHAQKEGVSTADISAGLAYSVVRNALYKVMAINDLSQLGEKVVVQGGTFMNDAVLRAFELESGLEVIRPDIANLMGAYGAALLARDEHLASQEAPACSAILNVYELATLRQKQSSLRCEACPNSCNLAVSSFCFDDEGRKSLSTYERLQERTGRKRSEYQQIKSDDSIFVSGNRCERGVLWAAEKLGLTAESGEGNRVKHAVNLIACEQRMLAQKEPEQTESLPRLGLPPVLGLYEHLVYWRALFSGLGFSVLPTRESSGTIYRLGAGAVLSETVCYPAKLMHGHIKSLVDEGADFIFMPTSETARGRECPVSSGYGHLASYDVQAFSEGKTTVLTTTLTEALPSDGDVRELLNQADLSASDEDINAAMSAASAAEQRFYERIWARAEAELCRLEQNNGTGIVLLGHPYHSDRGINHSIDRLLGDLGYAVFSVVSLERAAHAWSTAGPLDGSDNASLPAADWIPAARLYRVASLVARHPNLHAVHLHSFGCGVDALTTATVREIIQAAGKPCTAIKLDEMVDPATLHIRLRSLDHALSNNTARSAALDGDAPKVQQAGAPRIPPRSAALDGGAPKEPQALSVGQSLPEFSSEERQVSITENSLPEPFSGSFNQADCVALPPVSSEDVQHGLARLDNGLCYQMLALGGQILRWMDKASGKHCFMLPTLCRNCRGEELERVINQTLPSGKQVSIVSDSADAPVLVCGGEPFTESFAARHGTDRQGASCVDAQGNEVRTNNTGRHDVPRIGVLGNAAMLLTPQFNGLLLEKIRAEGAVPVLPGFEELFASEQPLPELLPQLYAQGIRDYIFVQSFGCLRSHVGARGALPRLKAEYPDCNITFLEYDPGISQVNQLSRLKLAVTIAFEREAASTRGLTLNP